MNDLKEQIKTKNFMHFIYIAGEETYLVDFYTSKVIDSILSDEERELNLHRYQAEEITVDILEDLIDTVSFFNDKKLIYLSGKKFSADVETYLADKVGKLDDETYILIKSEKLDARKKLAKAIKKSGSYTFFTYKKEQELKAFIAKQLSKKGIKIRQEVAEFFISYVGTHLSDISNELDKLSDYISADEVKKSDIEAVCVRSLESSIFDLVDTLGNSNAEKALSIYDDLILSKVGGTYVLAMMSRQFDLIYQTKKLLASGMSIYEISSFLGVQDFIIKKASRQGRDMSISYVESSFKKILRMTGLIREGLYEETTAVRQLIMELSE